MDDHGHDALWCSGDAVALHRVRDNHGILIITNTYGYEDPEIESEGGINVLGALRRPGISAEARRASAILFILISGVVQHVGPKHLLVTAEGIVAQRYWRNCSRTNRSRSWHPSFSMVFPSLCVPPLAGSWAWLC